jgi:D-glycero-alpha-D-manno-heptose-7-phosphate kinase
MDTQMLVQSEFKQKLSRQGASMHDGRRNGRMIVRSRAPLRLGLAGGGTDVEPYCGLYGGSIMNVTIDRYAYVTLERRADDRIVLESQDMGDPVTLPLAAVLPIDGVLDLHKAVYNRIIADYHGGQPIPLRLSTFSDAPPGSGLGSSSTLVVAIVQAFVEMLALPLGEYDVAHLAYTIERLDLKLNGGKQDQYAAAFGGFNFMEFGGADQVIVNPLKVKPWIASELEASTVLYFTGVSRDSAAIIDRQSQNVRNRNTISIEAMHRLKAESVAMKESILRGDFARLEHTFREGWLSKIQMANGISSPAIDRVYEAAMQAGAYAGKISGAGGGGFMLFLARLDQKRQLIKTLTSFGGRVEPCRFTMDGATAWRIG